MYADFEERNGLQQVKALVFALLIVAGIVITSMFVYLYRPVPLPSDVVVELELGSPYAGGGSGGSQKTDPQPTKSEAVAPSMTDNEKEAPEVNTPNNVSTKPVTSNHTTTKPNNTKPSNPNALFGGMSEEGSGGGNNNGDGKGEGGKKGDGYGPGHEPGVYNPNGNYSLEGRKLLEKPTVEGGFDAEGKVVVDIWVDQNGKVIRTAINESLTNTSNKDLRDRAKRAAKRVVWNVDNGADIEQKGSVTINFKLH